MEKLAKEVVQMKFLTHPWQVFFAGEFLWIFPWLEWLNCRHKDPHLFCNLVKTSGVQFPHIMSLKWITVHPKLLYKLVDHGRPITGSCFGYRSLVVSITILSPEYRVGRLGQHSAHREGQGSSEELRPKGTQCWFSFRQTTKNQKLLWRGRWTYAISKSSVSNIDRKQIQLPIRIPTKRNPIVCHIHRNKAKEITIILQTNTIGTIYLFSSLNDGFVDIIRR